MEMPDIGVQCHQRDCRALDYLPFTCQYCQKQFCEAHWKADKHSCPKRDLIVDRRVPSCPICQKVISLGPNEDPDTVVDRHINAGCDGKRNTARKQTPVRKPNGCTFKRCTLKSLVIDTCPGCRQRFCITHLHADVHECQKRAG
ncbi:hypothetical protein COEREDRAFT_21462, partial [Coemansia reversa NRRL 1564]